MGTSRPGHDTRDGAAARIYLLTQFYYPEKAAIAQFMTELAGQLNRRGFHITVLTSAATYNRGAERLPRHDEYDGVQIRRLWGTRFDKRNLAGRIVNLATFVLSALVALAGMRRADLLFISNAPLFGFLGRVARLLWGQRYLCLVQDVYPDLAVKLGVFGPGSVVRRTWDAINRQAYTRADAVVVLGSRMGEAVRRGLGEKAAGKVRLHVIPDWADGDSVRPIPRSENWFAIEQELLDRVVVLYSGNHGLAHDLETLVDAAERLAADKRFLFLFIGDGGKKPMLVSSVTERGLGNVRFLPYQPIENLPYTLTSGDISVVTMESGVEGLVIPSKIYGALAAGQAILALVGDKTEAGDIVAEHQCGFRVAPGDVETLVRDLRELADDPDRLADMKQRARLCYEANFRRDIAIDRYETLLRSLL